MPARGAGKRAALVQTVQLVGVFQNQRAGAHIALLRPSASAAGSSMACRAGASPCISSRTGASRSRWRSSLAIWAAQVQVLLVHSLIIADVRVPGDGHHRLLLDLVDLEDLPQMVGQNRPPSARRRRAGPAEAGWAAPHPAPPTMPSRSLVSRPAAGRRHTGPCSSGGERGGCGSMIWGISSGRMSSRYQARTYSRSPFFSSS